MIKINDTMWTYHSSTYVDTSVQLTTVLNLPFKRRRQLTILTHIYVNTVFITPVVTFLTYTDFTLMLILELS